VEIPADPFTSRHVTHCTALGHRPLLTAGIPRPGNIDICHTLPSFPLFGNFFRGRVRIYEFPFSCSLGFGSNGISILARRSSLHI